MAPRWQCRAGHLIPAIAGLSADCSEDDLKAISTAASSSGSVPLFHAVGITPEASTLDAAFQGNPAEPVIELGIEDLRQARDRLGRNPARLDR